MELHAIGIDLGKMRCIEVPLWQLRF